MIVFTILFISLELRSYIVILYSAALPINNSLHLRYFIKSLIKIFLMQCIQIFKYLEYRKNQLIKVNLIKKKRLKKS